MKSPFKFLDSYTREDRDIFFGRAREIEELYHHVFESRILLVYGISGTGKSSLIHCGLANKFQDTDWLPIVIRRGHNIIESLAAGINSTAITARYYDIDTPALFRKAVRSLYLDHYKPVFFIFDQFEELFIFGTKEERQAFIQVVKSLSESELQCRMIFVMREEYMAAVTEFEKYIPSFFSNRVRIEKMSHPNAGEAIEKSCMKAGIHIEQGFADALLERLTSSNNDIELTYLQVYLDKIFRIANGGNSFSLKMLEKAGNVSDLLGAFVEEQISLMEDPESAMSVLKAFVSAKGTKRPASETEVSENVNSFGKNIPESAIKSLINSLVNLRVLRDKDDSGRYELRHDSLAEKIFERFTIVEKELLELKHYIENAYELYRRRKTLLNNDDLTFIDNRDAELHLSADLKEFMKQNRKFEKIRLKTFKRLITVSIIAFILLLSAILYALLREYNNATSVDFASISINQYSRPVDRLSIAAYAWTHESGLAAKAAILSSFHYAMANPGSDTSLLRLKNRYMADFSPVSSPILFADCSDNGMFIYGYTIDSMVIWNINGEIYKSWNEPGVKYATFRNDGKYLGTISNDGALKIYDIIGCKTILMSRVSKDIRPNQVFRFGTGNSILAITGESLASMTDFKGNILQQFNTGGKRLNDLDISGDGQYLALAADSSIFIFRSDSEKTGFNNINTLKPHKGIINSIDFSPDGRYILSTSTDGAVRITNVYNYKVFRDNEEKSVPYDGKFDKTGTAITVKYQDNETVYVAGIFYDWSRWSVSVGQIKHFDELAFSPDKQYLVYRNDKEISLADRSTYLTNPYALFNNYRLSSLKGYFPFFSPDSRYVFTVCGRGIKRWFIDTKTISGICSEYLNRWASYLN
jgi:WD40 repeat protein